MWVELAMYLVFLDPVSPYPKMAQRNRVLVNEFLMKSTSLEIDGPARPIEGLSAHFEALFALFRRFLPNSGRRQVCARGFGGADSGQVAVAAEGSQVSVCKE